MSLTHITNDKSKGMSEDDPPHAEYTNTVNGGQVSGLHLGIKQLLPIGQPGETEYYL